MDGMARGSLLAVLSLALTLAPSEASASPQDLFGFGGRTSGLSMTGASYANNYEAVFMNPAGLGAVRRRSLSLGALGGNYQLSINGEASPLTPARGTTIGFTLPFPFEDVLEDRLTFGGAFYTPAEVILRGRVQYPTRPEWTVLNRAQSLAVQVGLGFDFHGIVDGLRLGVGVSALAAVLGELDVGLDETSSFTSTVETQLVTSFAPIVGVQYQQPEWGVGITYRHELVSSFELNIRTRDLPVELPVLRVGGIVSYDPSALILEGHWRPIPELMLVANLSTRFWSMYPGAQIPSSAMSLNAPAPEYSIVPVPRVAVEGTIHRDHALQFDVRGGYSFELSPSPPARMAQRRTAGGDPTGDPVAFRTLDNDRHVVTAGLGWTVFLGGEQEAQLAIDAYAQLHLLAPRTHEVGLTDGAPNMQTDGFIMMGGWTATLEF
ncbi:MAG: OmpP1/FadL family transporter [Sandaracinaceae bacterium]